MINEEGVHFWGLFKLDPLENFCPISSTKFKSARCKKKIQISLPLWNEAANR